MSAVIEKVKLEDGSFHHVAVSTDVLWERRVANHERKIANRQRIREAQAKKRAQSNVQ